MLSFNSSSLCGGKSLQKGLKIHNNSVSLPVKRMSTEAKSSSSSSTAKTTSQASRCTIPGNLAGYESLDQMLESYLPDEQLKEARRVLYGYNNGGSVQKNDLSPKVKSLGANSKDGAYDIQHYSFKAAKQQMTGARNTRIAVVQNKSPLPTTDPVVKQREAFWKRITEIIETAAAMNVQILCLQEAWTMPFAFCTREKGDWMEFAECAETGPTTELVQKLARKHNMVIVSPILERDYKHGQTIWNTAVVVSNTGAFLGKHRKNHIPRVFDFNESTYYLEGNTGHPVFETAFGKIAINICYGRHHPMNWQTFAMNGAEIIFNPSATVGDLSEPMWQIEGRSASSYFSCYTANINRVGTEVFPREFTSGDGKAPHKDFGHFYGSSYVSAPDASRTPSLSRCRDGLLVTDCDLNLCQQIKDKWMLQNTARYELYADFLNDYIQHDFEPQVIRDPAL